MAYSASRNFVVGFALDQAITFAAIETRKDRGTFGAQALFAVVAVEGISRATTEVITAFRAPVSSIKEGKAILAAHTVS